VARLAKRKQQLEKAGVNRRAAKIMAIIMGSDVQAYKRAARSAIRAITSGVTGVTRRERRRA